MIKIKKIAIILLLLSLLPVQIVFTSCWLENNESKLREVGFSEATVEKVQKFLNNPSSKNSDNYLKGHSILSDKKYEGIVNYILYDGAIDPNDNIILNLITANEENTKLLDNLIFVIDNYEYEFVSNLINSLDKNKKSYLLDDIETISALENINSVIVKKNNFEKIKLESEVINLNKIIIESENIDLKIVGNTINNLDKGKPYLDYYLKTIFTSNFKNISENGYSILFNYLEEKSYDPENVLTLVSKIDQRYYDEKLQVDTKEIIREATLEIIKYRYGSELSEHIAKLDINSLENDVYGDLDNRRNLQLIVNSLIPIEEKIIFTEDPIPSSNYDIEFLTDYEIKEIERGIKDILFYVINKYPSGFVNKYIKNIYIVKGITREDGINVGGYAAQSALSIYLVYYPREISMVQNFLHEFGHIVFDIYKDSFDSEQWKKNNPEEFEYVCGDYGEVIKEVFGDLDFIDINDAIDTMESGFLTKYSQVNMEEDFAETNTMIFEYYKAYLTPEENSIWDIENYKRLNRKVDIIKNIHTELDDRFDLEYFKNITPILIEKDGSIIR